MIQSKTRAVLLALLIAAGAATSAGAMTVQRGSAGASGVVRKAEAGVTVWRAAPLLDADLAGGDRVDPDGADTQIIIVDCRRGAKRYTRTQGFYSGHPGMSRRFTQGFWSGPVDLTRSSVRVVRVVRR